MQFTDKLIVSSELKLGTEETGVVAYQKAFRTGNTEWTDAITITWNDVELSSAHLRITAVNDDLGSSELQYSFKGASGTDAVTNVFTYNGVDPATLQLNGHLQVVHSDYGIRTTKVQIKVDGSYGDNFVYCAAVLACGRIGQIQPTIAFNV